MLRTSVCSFQKTLGASWEQVVLFFHQQVDCFLGVMKFISRIMEQYQTDAEAPNSGVCK